MQVTFISAILYFLLGWLCQDKKDICFQSDALKSLNLVKQDQAFYINDDSGQEIRIQMLEDSTGMIYWYRRLETPVCLTGECKLIDIGIYWQFNGDFLGLEVYGEHLTKTDHSTFSSSDYDKLMSVLKDDWSILREYEQEGLLNENYEEIDGSSGATKKEIADETVTGAVYTTYTIWHLIHQGENEQLILLTLKQLEDSEVLKDFVNCDRRQVQLFLLDQVNSGNLQTSPIIIDKIFNSLSSTDSHLKNLAFQALQQINFNSRSLQKELAFVLANATISEKQKILAALNNLTFVVPELYNKLAEDLTSDNEWFAAKILSILKHSSNQKEEVIQLATKLYESKNSYVSKIASDFLNLHH